MATNAVLEPLVNQAGLRLRVVERALHEDRIRWYIAVDGSADARLSTGIARAEVTTDDEGVSFTAHIASPGSGPVRVMLYAEHDLMYVEPLEIVHDKGEAFVITWRFALPAATFV
jgi:hypothetical protein